MSHVLHVISSASRQVIDANAVIGHREGTYYDIRVILQHKAITLSHEVVSKARHIFMEEFVQVIIATKKKAYWQLSFRQ